MEGSFLHAAGWRREGAHRRRTLIELPMLGLVAFVLDALLLVFPGLIVAGRYDLLTPGNPATVEVGLAVCLGAVFFFAASRALDAHDGVALMRRSILAQLLVVATGF